MPTALAPRPLVRLLPAPATDPPYDDEPPAEGWAATVPVPGAAAPWAAATTRPSPARPNDTPPSARALVPGACPYPDGGPVHPRSEVSAAARTAAARFVNACLEIWNGYRPVAHVHALCNPMDALSIQHEMRRAARRLTRGRGTGGRRLVLRRMRVCEPRAGAIEISAVVGTGTATATATATATSQPERAWAAAFRLEQRDGRWRCTLARLL
jgi:hypothetical protein